MLGCSDAQRGAQAGAFVLSAEFGDVGAHVDFEHIFAVERFFPVGERDFEFVLAALALFVAAGVGFDDAAARSPCKV